MNFENNESSLSLEQNENNYELENQEVELTIEDNTPQATFENVVTEISFEAPKTKVNMDYNEASNKPQINGVELIENKTTEDLGIVGTSMTEIDVSTNLEEPTDISQYFEKSGTYVAKNTGVIGFLDEAVPIAKGGFFTVQNFKDLASQFGMEISEEENEIKVNLSLCVPGLTEDIVLKKVGTDDWYASVKITNENASDYLDLDIDVTSEVQQVLKASVSATYGMQLIGNYLSFMSASTTEINNASSSYRVITPANIKYAIEKWGASYYATKEEKESLENNLTTLQNNLDALKTEIETILESVVVVDE